uniref:NADH-ubiquinone oxidoreductase chain 5 n=1 Tax=Opimothrips tubulatus TaxID=2724111 RepID=A0A9E9ETU2_9NEOP|nr:NADH dehydrogenase subunit 5 [Opimothrips tubulatus]WAO28728.1 NADH dehydrogenase subunit 5 [Opimothrips tubulatus]
MLKFNEICNLFFMFLLFSSFLFFILSFYLFYFKFSVIMDWEYYEFMSMKFNFLVYLDFMSSLFLSLVFFISSLILMYSKVYMKADVYNLRFIWILIFFVLSMMFFIICPNIISLILGWDGLGLVSYCLVIYYQNFSANVSGMITALSNRIGDSFLIISICYFMNFGMFNYLNLKTSLFNLGLVMILILISITKSAQIPFSSWLPAAMAAPTPVSSLVHSSTLVTAGVFLMIRFNHYLMLNYISYYTLMILSLLTLCMAGLSANVEMDFKKIIALSTLSQLGMMMSSLSMGLKEISFFHLIMHALFKALMFMCSGNFIHLNFSTQDLRFYGKSMYISEVSYLMFSISNLSLCGMPFLCGFYSKDLILELVLMKNLNFLLFFFYMFGTFLTVMYSYRLLSFSMKKNYNFFLKMSSLDESFVMNLSMFPLLVLSIFGGGFFSFFFLFPMNYIILPLKLKFFILMICLTSLIMSIYLKHTLNNFLNIFNILFVFEFFNSLMFLTILSKKNISTFGLLISKKMFKTFSDGWIEYFYGLIFLNNFFDYLINFMNKLEQVYLQMLLYFSLNIFFFSYMFL